MNSMRFSIQNGLRLLLSTSLVLLGVLGTVAPVSASSGVIYVYWKAQGANNGTSWNDAYTDLQSALNAAVRDNQIWVEAGTYRPDSNKEDRTATFRLKSGVGVFGGFAGTETSVGQRRPQVNITLLSGEISNPTVTSDNSYHVVTGSGADKAAVLDGFTISGGNANGSYPYNGGGGVYNDGFTNVVLSHLVITNNAGGFGGGMANVNGADPSLSNITFKTNTAALGGGLYNISGSNPGLSHVTFEDNDATSGGGGMYDYGSSPRLTDVTFSGNYGGHVGGGIMNDNGSSPPLLRVILYNNSSGDSGGGISNANASSPGMTDVTIDSNVSTNGGGMYNGVDSDPGISRATISNNLSISGGGVFNSSSIAKFTNVTFSGNRAHYGGGMYNFNTSSPSLTNVTFSGNTAGDGGGAITNNINSSPIIKDSIFWGDQSEIYNTWGTPSIFDSIVAGGCPTGSMCNHVSHADPMLGALANNGGLTNTLALGTGSAAVDAGNNATCATTDQRGIARPQGSACDMGAYELVR